MLNRLIILLPILIFFCFCHLFNKQPLIINFKQNSFQDTKRTTLI